MSTSSFSWDAVSIAWHAHSPGATRSMGATIMSTGVGEMRGSKLRCTHG
jgi:hypothetical protein